jgi:ABC-type lipoprotein export system ATPase subunit
MIELTNISKTYQRGRESVCALKNVSLTIKQGEYLGVVGPSGSGKSTLMHIIGLLDVPTSGAGVICGKNLVGMKEAEKNRLRQKCVGFVFQEFLLLPTMTALQNVMLPMYFAKNANAPKRAQELLERVGLGQRVSHLPSQMSGGEMQRVAIARALANRPDILLADEPSGNLDSKTAENIYELFKEINKEGTTIVMVTHNNELAGTLPRVIALHDGKIEKDGRQQ